MISKVKNKKKMKNKYLVNEQQTSTGTNATGSEKIQNKLLKLAVNNQCFVEKGFPNAAFKDLKTGKEVMYKKSDNKTLIDENRRYIFILPEDDGISFTIEYRDRPDEQGKVIKSKSGIRCKKITKTADPVTTPDQEEIIQFLRQNGFKNKTEIKPDQWVNYSEVDIYQDPDVKVLLKDKPDLLKMLESNKDRVFKMWKGSTSVSGLKGDFEDKSKEGEKFVDFLIKSNWKKKSEITPELSTQYFVYDLSKPEEYSKSQFLNKYKDYVKYFQPGFLMYEPIASKSVADVVQQIKKDEESIKIDYNKKDCRNIIVNFINDWRMGNEFPTSPKDIVQNCLRKNAGMYPALEKELDKFRRMSSVGRELNFRIDPNINFQEKLRRESTEDNLKKIISESLNKAKLNKKSLIKESKIVRNRLEILVENRDLRRKKDLQAFFNDYLNETIHFNSKGYNTEIINEQFFDILKGFFTGTGLDSIMGTFKEYAAKWLINKFGLDADSWIGSVVTTAFGNLPLGDIPKLTQCDYVVPFLAKTLGESAVKKFMSEKGVDNAFTSVVRNAIVEVLEDTAFGQSIEKGLEKIICPSLGDLSKKMGKVTNNLKNKALDDKDVLGGSAPSIPGGGLMQAI